MPAGALVAITLFFDIGIAVLPYLFAGTVLCWVVQAFDTDMPFGKFIKRSTLLWVGAVIIAQVVRVFVYFLVNQTILTVGGLVFELIETAIFFILWRATFKFAYQTSMDPTKMKLKQVVWISIVAVCLLGLLATLLFLYSIVQYSRLVYQVADAPVRETALVLGAGVWLDGTPSSVIVAQVKTAAELYQAEKVDYIVLSGDSREVDAMCQIAQDFNVADSDLVLDRTIHSCENELEDHEYASVSVITQNIIYLGQSLFATR